VTGSPTYSYNPEIWGEYVPKELLGTTGGNMAFEICPAYNTV